MLLANMSAWQKTPTICVTGIFPFSSPPNNKWKRNSVCYNLIVLRFPLEHMEKEHLKSISSRCSKCKYTMKKCLIEDFNMKQLTISEKTERSTNRPFSYKALCSSSFSNQFCWWFCFWSLASKDIKAIHPLIL